VLPLDLFTAESPFEVAAGNTDVTADRPFWLKK
jgi:hypothetical protein